MAGQKYWKKVKGEWVNTLALERQQGKVPKPKTEKERPQKLEGGGIASGMRRFNRGGKV